HEKRGRRAIVDTECDFAVARIAGCVARDLGNCGRNARLRLTVEAEHLGRAPCIQARSHDIARVQQWHGGECAIHGRRVLDTAMLTSSRPRAKSRYSTPATSNGCAPISPG